MVLLIGVAMAVSVGLSAIVPAGDQHQTGLDLTGWAISLTIAVVAGAAIWGWGVMIGKKQKRPLAMRRREAMALVGTGWFACSAVAALPYYFCDPGVPLDFAFFEGVSGLTTTGSSIFVDLGSLPQSILMWRSFTQWVGGMGILAMFVVVLSGMTSSSKTLIGAESSLSNTDIASLRQTMRRLWVLYLGFTMICGLGLWAMGLSPFQAVNHALTAVSTGGFGTEEASVGAPVFGAGSKLWLIFFMILGAISFPFYLTLMKRNRKNLRERFEEVYWFLGLVAFASLVLLIQHFAGDFDQAAPVDILFNLVSVVTSTGYVSSNLSEWSRLGVGILLLLMVIGGCSGSTAGGLKVSRIILWIRFLKAGLHRTFRPRLVDPIKLNGRKVGDDSVEQLFLVISLFGFFAITGTFFLQLLEPEQALMGSLSAVISCLGNIGPALADMGNLESFAEVGTTAKLMFALMMILGRLEYIAFLVLFSRQLWKRY
ncbi:MAG: TrkH family potassium uptake protein [Akkermansiaceae bacterium]|jgi:trk system potassium uptake protein TrkH